MSLSWRNILRAVAIAILPVVVVSMLLWVFMGVTIFDYVPARHPDEVSYWHQAASLRAVGFESGYYNVDENPASLTLSPYGGWGFVVPMAFAPFTATFYSHVLLNCVLVIVALFIFDLSVPTKPRDHIALALTAILFVPWLIYLPTNMLEASQYALAVVLATLFYPLLRGEQRRWQWWLLLGLLVAASFLRVTWLFLLWPALLLRSSQWSWRMAITQTVVFIALLLPIMAMTMVIAAPFPSFLTDLTDTATISFMAAMGMLLGYALQNLQQFLQPEDYFHVTVQRLQIVVLLVGSVIGVVQYLGRKQHRQWVIPLFNLYNLGIILLILLLFYGFEAWRDFRVLAPHLLLTLLLLIAFARWRLLTVVNGLMLASLPVILLMYAAGWYLPNYSPRIDELLVQWDERIDAVIQYDPVVPTAWCNTLLRSVEERNHTYISLVTDPGIGLSRIFRPQLLNPVQSRYLLLSSADYAVLSQHTTLQHALTIDDNLGLYINLDASC